ncbi:hypothetical protein D3C81_1491490 [compost metagenome]
MRFHHLALALSVALSACAPQVGAQFAVDGPDGWSRRAGTGNAGKSKRGSLVAELYGRSGQDGREVIRSVWEGAPAFLQVEALRF